MLKHSKTVKKRDAKRQKNYCIANTANECEKEILSFFFIIYLCLRAHAEANKKKEMKIWSAFMKEKIRKKHINNSNNLWPLIKIRENEIKSARITLYVHCRLQTNEIVLYCNGTGSATVVSHCTSLTLIKCG